MSSRVWLLVEWVDESNVFASYGVVNVDTLAYDETDLHTGNVIFIRVKHENPRRAKILRISENKQYVKEYKEILERQDQQVKNVLQLCMRTIKEMKTDPSASGVSYKAQQPSNHSALPHVVIASNIDSASDSETENNSQIERRVHKPLPKNPTQFNRKESRTSQIRGSLNTSQSRRRSMVSSTPIPSSTIQKNIKLYFDQATQTEGTFLQPPRAKIEEMEAVLKNLYRRFQYLVSQVNVNSNGSTSMSESEHNDDGSYIEPNNGEPWPESNNIEYENQGNVEPDNVPDVGAVQVIEANGGNQPVNSSDAKVEDLTNPNALRVRRMSAQTTNNVESLSSIDADLVPIGNGNTKVPVRLLNEINWNSHTSATRQLLQAVFPRRVLATHSLTGKQSPAFMNRPPKKILDPKLVEDIVKIVSTRCNVPKNLVRNSITIKCTDEAKLYRNRMQYKQQRKLENDENRPPSTPSSDESTHTVLN